MNGHETEEVGKMLEDIERINTIKIMDSAESTIKRDYFKKKHWFSNSLLERLVVELYEKINKM